MSRDTIRLPRDAYRLLQTLRAAGLPAGAVRLRDTARFFGAPAGCGKRMLR